jgi:two-component system sensor histidine kinase BaeS
MRTLRGRLIVSHILPLVLVVPLAAAALIYILETQVQLTNLADEMMEQGATTASMASNQPAIWADLSEAQRFVTLYSISSRSQVMLFDANGNLLAASEAGGNAPVDQPLDLGDVHAALAGERNVHVNYSTSLQAEIVQVFVPVVGPNQEVMGAVHMTQGLSQLHDRFTRLRRLILGALAVDLVLGVIIGLILALSLGRSLQRVTDGIYGVASGRQWETLPEQDPKEIRMLLRAFNTLIERLRLLEDSRRHLLANLVHELGRPLGAIQSALHALLGGADTDPELRRELLEGMDDQVQRLRPLVDSLADLHGQVLGTLELNLEPVTLGDWLPRTVAPWRQTAHDKGLHWEIDIRVPAAVVEVDPDRLAQALGNLLSNAIKYTPQGTISVEAFAQDGKLAIVIGDTGIGVAPLEQDRIFEPFYRSRRDKRFPQGMGLGLSIARDLVVAHGGRLQVESVPNEGSRFTITLPLATAPRTGKTDKSLPHPEPVR